MRILLPSKSWIDVRDNLAPMDRYAVRDAPDVSNEDGQVTVKNASGNMWRTFLSRTIVDWSFDAPIPSRDPASLDRFPDLEEDQDALEDALRERFDRITARRSPNLRKPPAPTNATSSG
jgi:hypothetical protein